jgi:hypothetical protein
MGALLTSNIFWQLLAPKFNSDERYQAQSLFLPDSQRKIKTIFVGDSKFLSSLPPKMKRTKKAEKIIITGYDPYDLSDVLTAIVRGQRFTKTRVCGLVVQVSPLFSVRGTPLGSRQNTSLLRYKSITGINPRRNGKAFFDTLSRWANARRGKPTLKSNPGRPKRMAAQARFADPNKELWNMAFRGVGRYKGKILAVLDSRGTEWGSDSDLIQSTRSGLDQLAAEHDNFRWVNLADLPGTNAPDCSA